MVGPVAEAQHDPVAEAQHGPVEVEEAQCDPVVEAQHSPVEVEEAQHSLVEAAQKDSVAGAQRGPVAKAQQSPVEGAQRGPDEQGQLLSSTTIIKHFILFHILCVSPKFWLFLRYCGHTHRHSNHKTVGKGPKEPIHHTELQVSHRYLPPILLEPVEQPPHLLCYQCARH